MGEMREWWANVYPPTLGAASTGNRYEAPAFADALACRDRYARIHVRLKPEGAPKRYANENNRRAWEKHEDWCRDHVARGTDPTFLSVWEGL